MLFTRFDQSAASVLPTLRCGGALVAVLILASGASTGAAQPPATKAGPGPHIAGCPIFPGDNVWNVPIDKLPLDPRSKDYVNSIGADKPLHPDFGPGNGYILNITDGHVPWVKVTIDYADESDPGYYPIPPNALIENGEDHHVFVIDKERCMLVELWEGQRVSATAWKAGSGIKMDLTGNGLRADGKTSADAAGLPIVPGIVRYDEVAAGEIRHALRFTVPKTQQAHIWPARHDASKITDPKYPPMGVRFRLRADYDISGFSKTNQVILTALKRYGMFLADNGGAWFVSGETDPRWNDDDLHKLTNVKGGDFEAVDESDLEYLPDSARVDPTAKR